MFSCYFLRARIIRQSIQVLCPVFSRKVLFQGCWKFKQSLDFKNIAECESPWFCRTGGRVISAAKQSEILHVPLVATNDLLSESSNSIFGTSFFLRETMNSLRGTNKLAFTGNMNSLLKGSLFGQHKLVLSGEPNLPSQATWNPSWETNLPCQAT